MQSRKEEFLATLDMVLIARNGNLLLMESELKHIQPVPGYITIK